MRKTTDVNLWPTHTGERQHKFKTHKTYVLLILDVKNIAGLKSTKAGVCWHHSTELMIIHTHVQR